MQYLDEKINEFIYEDNLIPKKSLENHNIQKNIEQSNNRKNMQVVSDPKM